MSELDAVAETPVDIPAEPPAEPAADPQPVAAAPIDPDEALDASIEANTVELPNGEKLAPVEPQKAAIIALRRELKLHKDGSKRAAELEQQLSQMQQQLAALQPQADAFRALQAQATLQPQPVQPTGPTAEDVRELEEVARDYDFYKPDGQLDTDRAGRHLARVRREAEKIAQQQIAPLQQHNLSTQVQNNVARALATKHPVNGDGVDPSILNAMVQQVANQSGGLETLADPEAMKQMWLNAYALSTLRPRQSPQAQAAAPVLPQLQPVPTERSGGAAAGGDKPMTARESRHAREMGLTESEYLKIAAKMPW